MKGTCCIVIPIYKTALNVRECMILQDCITKLASWPIRFMAPQDAELSWYHEKYPNIQIEIFTKWEANSLDAYNRLLLTTEFYQRFNEFEYIMIFQLDAMLLGTTQQLNEFIKLDYDYIGAPWGENGYRFCKRIIPGAGHSRFLYWLEQSVTCHVGNGGVSLRKTAQMISLLLEKRKQVEKWTKAEDIFFSYHGQKSKCNFRIAPKEVAYQFAMESDMKEKMEKGLIPFAVHKWEQYAPELFEQYFGNEI